MSEVTRILSQIESGDPLAAEQLLPLVYDELRRMAAAQMAQEKPGQTLQATGLVHEAYVKLIGCDLPTTYANRRHFFGERHGHSWCAIGGKTKVGRSGSLTRSTTC